ncbi:hypothetical protein C8Q75DRAFT_893711 [Abortiporus biennis]|nr:hypothetical protein C8Q75DRAFT_893711 [Abortiporus biennis]
MTNFSDLPSELRTIIIEQLHGDKDSLRVSSLVCKDWAHLSQQDLFSSIEISNRMRFEEFQALSPHVLRYIKALSICNSKDLSSPSTLDIKFGELVDVLTALHNLKSLYFNCVKIDLHCGFRHEFMQPSVSSVTSLRLVASKFQSTPNFGQSTSSFFEMFPYLTCLSLINMTFPTHGQLASSAVIGLSPFSPHLTSVTIILDAINFPFVLRDIMNGPSFHKITLLNVSLWDHSHIRLLGDMLDTLGPVLKSLMLRMELEDACEDKVREWVHDLKLHKCSYLSAFSLSFALSSLCTQRDHVPLCSWQGIPHFLEVLPRLTLRNITFGATFRRVPPERITKWFDILARHLPSVGWANIISHLEAFSHLETISLLFFKPFEALPTHAFLPTPEVVDFFGEQFCEYGKRGMLRL